MSGSFTMDAKRAKLQSLKARTTCRKCGAVGHWSGDAQCPLTRGKGKAHIPRAGADSTSSTTTTTATRGTPPQRGTSREGQAPKQRTVYFMINEDQPHSRTAHLALRSSDGISKASPLTPQTGNQNYQRMPPPSSLQDPRPSSSPSSSNEDSIAWQVVPDRNRWLHGLEHDDDMVMLIDALGNDDPHEDTTEQYRLMVGDAWDMPTPAIANVPTSTNAQAPEPAASTTRSPTCRDLNVTRVGSNQHQWVSKDAELPRRRLSGVLQQEQDHKQPR